MTMDYVLIDAIKWFITLKPLLIIALTVSMSTAIFVAVLSLTRRGAKG